MKYLPELLTADKCKGTIVDGNQSANLDNENSACASVQTAREFITKDGCHVTAYHRIEYNPAIRRDVARMLLTTVERNDEYAACNVSVQGVVERSA